ncbi:30S ribosomal protein S8 [Candidatus Finniella inopinata]|uniref:Small ribosomal subunit protein uS8 n=1 Tax=Candidatus Finniella inopinata TaxID=1696036 RepID=A0A4Q7DIT6_9PROT|nr:30S ribosomal protein S8 [Candidatus Finniella inopinata]RZI46260.1 30S ribosomal protein S8 [Candidatus Finniella inopinata]
MTILDPIGDLLTRIRNAHMIGKTSVLSPASKARARVLDVLLEEGYIRGYTKDIDDRGHPTLKVELKYHEGAPVIRNIKRVSTPGRRVYSSIKDLPHVYNGLGINILSTSQGVMSDVKARQLSVSGEVICSVF